MVAPRLRMLKSYAPYATDHLLLIYALNEINNIHDSAM
jgi:hypothetical protein